MHCVYKTYIVITVWNDKISNYFTDACLSTSSKKFKHFWYFSTLAISFSVIFFNLVRSELCFKSAIFTFLARGFFAAFWKCYSYDSFFFVIASITRMIVLLNPSAARSSMVVNVSSTTSCKYATIFFILCIYRICDMDVMIDIFASCIIYLSCMCFLGMLIA